MMCKKRIGYFPIPLGALRYMLAVGVLFSHTRLEPLVGLGWNPGSIGTFNVGPVAVVVFCCISGYVMTRLIDSYYKLEGLPAAKIRIYLSYLTDRSARLFPQFLFYLMLALSVSTFTSISVSPRWSRDFETIDLLFNLSMILLGFFPWLPSMEMLIPQGWSLGLEWCFYLLAPVLLAAQRWVIIYATGYLSMGFFLFPFFGLINQTSWGYIFLPGLMFVFVLGMVQADHDYRRRKKYQLIMLIFSVLLLLLRMLIPSLDFDAGDVNKEVLLGAVLAVVVSQGFRAAQSSRIDGIFGNLSYGVFLNHLVVGSVVDELLPTEADTFEFLVVVAVSTLASALTFRFLEYPVLKWRRRQRQVMVR